MQGFFFTFRTVRELLIEDRQDWSNLGDRLSQPSVKTNYWEVLETTSALNATNAPVPAGKNFWSRLYQLNLLVFFSSEFRTFSLFSLHGFARPRKTESKLSQMVNLVVTLKRPFSKARKRNKSVNGCEYKTEVSRCSIVRWLYTHFYTLFFSHDTKKISLCWPADSTQ